MNFDRVSISLVPRTTADCLDLAVMFISRRLPVMMLLWCAVAVPSCFCVYLMCSLFEADALWAAAVVFFASSPLGVCLGLVAVPSAFGEPFSLQTLWRRLRRGSSMLLLKGIAWRFVIWFGLLLCLIPGCWIAVRTGFFVEKACFSKRARKLHDRQTDDLLKEETGNLLYRGLWILAYCLLLWGVLFVSLDVACSVLFAVPILFGRIFTADSVFRPDVMIELLFDLMWYDPLVLTALTATALLVYPVGRLAWFFCYVDLRVRRDCWDMQLRFAEEAKRLEAPA
jgi:hypothetical protein